MNLRALNLATGLTIMFVAVMTTVAELSSRFKNALAGVTGHHWVSKGVLSVLFFVVVYFLMRKNEKELSAREIYATIGITVLAGLVLLIFFLLMFVREVV